MANTTDLKQVENELILKFCKKYHLKQLHLSQNQRLNLLFGMNPDIIAYDLSSKRLYFGEVTTSGFLGSKKSNTHNGAQKKIEQAFGKFFIIKNNYDDLKNQLMIYDNTLVIESIACYFIIPDGSKFITSIGYRKRLLSNEIMKLEQIVLSDTMMELMTKILENCRKEQEK